MTSGGQPLTSALYSQQHIQHRCSEPSGLVVNDLSYRPRGCRFDSTIVLVHAGGWISCESYRQGPAQNCLRGCPGSSLEYPSTLDKASSHKNREA